MNYLAKIDKIAAENNLEPFHLALAYIFSLKNINHYIIGTTSLKNIKNNIKILNSELSNDSLRRINHLSKKSKLWADLRFI